MLLRKYGNFQECMIKIYTRQILKGLDYLHSFGIVHRDIKGANILVSSEAVCKLSDFGGAKILMQKGNEQFLGTPNWIAPEILRGERYTRYADIWSVGCTVLEMLTALPPWSTIKNQMKLMNKVAMTKKPPTYPKKLSPECKDFLNNCFKINPRERMRARDLLNHPFLAEAEERVIEASPGALGQNDCERFLAYYLAEKEESESEDKTSVDVDYKEEE